MTPDIPALSIWAQAHIEWQYFSIQLNRSGGLSGGVLVQELRNPVQYSAG